MIQPACYPFFNDSHTNNNFDTFNQIIQYTLDSHVPIKKIKVVHSRRCPFLTSDIKNVMKIKDQEHRQYLQTRDDLDWS